ncbi:Cholinephosphotransferase 1 [Bienertia sinuspersici]
MITFREDTFNSFYDINVNDDHNQSLFPTNLQSIKTSNLFAHRPCDEIYVVSEGETLHTISDKCGDPFIVERNPHIHDPDDVFPGLVIKILPSPPIKDNRKLLW